MNFFLKDTLRLFFKSTAKNACRYAKKNSITISQIQFKDRCSQIERFSYELEMCTCEQNANNRLNEQKSSRLITQTRAGFDWSCKHAMFSSELKLIF